MAETKKTTKTATTKTTTAKKTATPKVASASAKTAKTTAPKKTAEKTSTAKVANKVDNKQPKVAEQKVAKKATKQIKVTYTKSAIGYDKRQAKILQSLGLKKLHSFSILPDNASTRGMIHKVAHLVTVEEVK